ncbi:hypothetical protein RJ639_001758 [Escallonia herrerae]|uniref:Non-haem dioxygenase N-terminal domain-containing protein n=1 Tax=Escallonia herrerae TaxID=1293975 RepID=A0AA88X9F6_9ASTE|nr:hypothetical protein RJ639_001758 [Escallonia herrerae]
MEPTVLSSGFRYTSLPESYVRPETDRPKLSEVWELENVPVIDLGCGDRSLISQQIGDACRDFGFFQLINHGVSTEAAVRMQEVAREFFRLPVEEKMKLYSDDPSKTMRLSTSFNVTKEQVHNWRDYLRLHCHPLDKYTPEWPSNPSSFNVWHRATVNADQARMSIASFLCPHDDATISAPEKLSDDGSQAVYRNFTYTEYYKKFWSRNLDQEHCLELFKN